VRRLTPGRSPTAEGYSLVLAADFRSGGLSALRRRVAQALHGCDLDQQVRDGFVIAVNEVMSNAVRHGGGHGRLRLWTNGAVLCEVEDHGEGFAAERYVNRADRPTATPSGGMGLWIAQQTSARLAIESGRSGTTVRLVAGR
jgi:anti-sigma regulatory factor (Ser/Thr protein kinase)